MHEDLEAFLKQAAQQRKPKTSPAPQIVDAEVVYEADLVPVKTLNESDLAPVNPSGQSVTTHVQQHLNTGAHEERVSHLGERVGQADDLLESHLHQVFDHQLGRLGKTSLSDDIHEPATEDPYATHIKRQPTPVEARGEASSEGEPSLADELAAALRSPRSVRQALILGELLSRPTHRW